MFSYTIDRITIIRYLIVAIVNAAGRIRVVAQWFIGLVVFL